MGKPAFGTYDNFAVYEMAKSPVAADVYEQHIREVQMQHERIGFDIFCANHHVGPIKTEHAVKSMELFAKEVMPVFA